MGRRRVIASSLVALSGLVALGCAPPGGSTDTVTAVAPGAPVAASQAVDEFGVTRGGITVVGEGSTQVAPDAARVVLGVEVSDEDVSAAFEEANATARDVISAVQDAGVPEEDIQTVELSVRERREEPPGPAQQGPPEITGYTVTNLVEVRISDVGAASGVIDAAVEAGGDAARVQQFQLVVDQTGVLFEEARAAAFEDARQRAELYAELAEAELGELVSLSEIVGGGPGPVVSFDRAALEAAGPPIQGGRQEVTVRIEATWALG